MSQRASGYARVEGDRYETPDWVTLALLPHLRHLKKRDVVYEPAAGGGKIATVLRTAGFQVVAFDIADGHDFLGMFQSTARAVITNPPYHQAQAFIEHALVLMQPACGLVAMLLRTDYDHAGSRQHLFRTCPAFSCKVVLTRRIRWIENTKGSPSFNHAWFIWDHLHQGAPTIAYGP